MCCSAASDGRAATGPDHSSGPHRDFPLRHQRKPSTGRLLAKRRKSGMESFCRPFLKLIEFVAFFLNFGQTNILRRRHSNWIKDYTEPIPTNSIELSYTAEGVINASERDQVEHKDSRALMASGLPHPSFEWLWFPELSPDWKLHECVSFHSERLE